MIGTQEAIAGGAAASSPALADSGGSASGNSVDNPQPTSGSNMGATGSTLSNMLGADPNWVNLLGTLGAAGLGVYGANQQADAFRDIANQARADRAPFLSQATSWLQNPDAYWQGPGKTSLDATLRALSAKGGNPIDQPTSLAIASQAGLRDWRDAVTGFGNLGLAGEDTRAAMLGNAARAEGGIYDSLGYGLGELTRPKRTSFADYLKSLS